MEVRELKGFAVKYNMVRSEIKNRDREEKVICMQDLMEYEEMCCGIELVWMVLPS